MKIIIYLLILSMVIFVVVDRIDFQQLPALLLQVNYYLLASALLLKIMSLYIKAVRWGVAMIAAGLDHKPKQLLSATLIGAVSNIILPARFGEIARTVIAKKYNSQSGVSIFTSLSAMLLMDLILLTTLFLLFFPGDHNLGDLNISSSVLMLFAVCVMLITFLFIIKMQDIKIVPKKYTHAIDRKLQLLRSHVNNSIGALKLIISNPKRLLQTFILTIILWLTEGVALWLALRAFSVNSNLQLTVILLAALNVSFLLSLTPANIGVHQLISVFVLGYYGIDYSLAFAFSIGFQSMVILTILIAGTASFFWLEIGSHRKNNKKTQP